MARPAKNPDSVLPFPPYGSFVSFFDDLHAMGILPNRINAQVFEPSYSGSTVAQVLRAFRLFGLMNDDGEPDEDRLKALINPETRPAALNRLFRAKYAGLFAIPLAKAGPGEFNQWFASAGMDATATRKARAFFLTAARENGFEMHPTVAAKSPRRGPRGKRKTPKRSTVDGVFEPAAAASSQEPEILFHPAIDAYLRAARTVIESGAWDKAARDRVVQGFETQLDLFLPVKVKPER